jgi:hypothetical protein
MRPQERQRRNSSVAAPAPVPPLRLDPLQLDSIRSTLVPLTPSPMRPKVRILDHEDDLDANTNQDYGIPRGLEPRFDATDEIEGDVESLEMDMDESLEMDLGNSPTGFATHKHPKVPIKTTHKTITKLPWDADSRILSTMEGPRFINDFLTPYKLCILMMVLRYWKTREEMNGEWKVLVGVWLIRWIHEKEDPTDPPLNEILHEMRLCSDKEYANLAEYFIEQVSL